MNVSPRIFCDLDDVLTAFEESASDVIGISIRKISQSRVWDLLEDKYGFFEVLPWKKGER